MAFISWWYGPGWVREVSRVRERLARTVDFFSIELLLATLFSPFRQISAGQGQGPIGVLLRAWFDQLVSRLIGAIVRTFMIIIGVITLLLVCILGVLRLVVWPLAPVSPVVLVVVGLIGWTP